MIFADGVVARAYELPERDALRGLPLWLYLGKVHDEDLPGLRRAIFEQEDEGSFHYKHRIVLDDRSVLPTRTSGFDFHKGGLPPRRIGMIEFNAAGELTPLERFVDGCLATYQWARETEHPVLQFHIGQALMEVGFDLARSLTTRD